MATARKYRGKYPNRIKAVWGTSTRGVYCAQTNTGAHFFYAAREAIAAGFGKCHSQVMGLDVTDPKVAAFMGTSIARAAAAQG